MIRVCLLFTAIATNVVAQVSQDWKFLSRKLKGKFKRHPIVTTVSGQVQGIREASGFFHMFYAFKGIPYATSPVGDLRFRNPKSHEGWSGVRDASKHGHHCPNEGIMGIGAGGDEDCLYLNVYSTNLTGNFPVMFWIHGGAFLIGDGNSLVYGPDLLLREDVVVVTINYRLSSLGFLSTGDKHAQGNYGLKDIVMALRFVKENIAAFGGNPDKVTVFGQSAGSTAIHLLLLSDMSEGLFHQAIMQSGTGLSLFAIQTEPRVRAEELGKKLGLKFNSTEELMDQLRSAKYRDIINAERGLFSMKKPLGLRPFDFVPTIEREDSLEERFLTDDPTTLMLKGKLRSVPLIIGTTSNEGLLMVRQYWIDNKVFDEFNENDEFFVPLSFKLTKGSSQIKQVADAFKKLYFDGRPLSRDSLNGWARFQTDAGFKFPTDRTIKFIAETSLHPTYYYNFSFSGPLNFLKTLLFLRGYEGACHADDIFHLFTPAFPIPVWPTDHSLTVRRRLVRLFTNFAKFG